jgi:hypothetical protein
MCFSVIASPQGERTGGDSQSDVYIYPSADVLPGDTPRMAGAFTGWI